METIDVKVGQIWADNDKRGYGRKVRVIEVVREKEGFKLANPYAIVEQVTGRQSWSTKPGRRTRIRLDRFRPTSTGYRLVEDAPEG